MSEEPPKQQELPGRLDRDDKSAKWNRDWEIHADQGIGELPDGSSESSTEIPPNLSTPSEVSNSKYKELSGDDAKPYIEAAKRMFEEKDRKKSKE